MSERVIYHVVPEANSWAVRSQDGGDGSSADTKQEAIEDARRRAKEHDLSQVIVHTGDGRIETEYTYGEDPRDIPG